MANHEQKPKKNLSTSTARMRDPLHYDGSCTYAGQTYSDGSIVDQAGSRMECHDGTWRPAKKIAPKKPTVVVADKGTK